MAFLVFFFFFYDYFNSLLGALLVLNGLFTSNLYTTNSVLSPR